MWLLGGLLALALPGCDEKKTIGPTRIYTGPITETTNVVELISDSAKLKLRLTAPLEQRFETEVVYAKGLKVTFYAKDGKTVVNTLTARYGKVEQGKELYTMRGNVVVANVPEQQQLFTEELFFDRGKQLIYTKPDMFVKVLTPTERLTGTGLTANQNFSSYRITHPEGVFAVDQAVAP
ncbi:LPS export ABC transporter periplasmic protein LptC [Hymenobacter caeli]|uniref:LPS export ABC transporter protein LptC n=1 Tax=Hymenobacter caeli TaxID=2735894 RepID=A0ABX2FPN8_9BACT|nr:LPS export ABC transporter periplasmic protein LptC [Hymenobacter caeli]NRT18922.1 LPS export ABC transporter protein LptC [Hymenobacter caeli]